MTKYTITQKGLESIKKRIRRNERKQTISKVLKIIDDFWDKNKKKIGMITRDLKTKGKVYGVEASAVKEFSFRDWERLIKQIKELKGK